MKKQTKKQDLVRRFTKFFHCEGTSVSGWTSCSVALRRCQITDRKQYAGRWVDYPPDRMGWITDTGRCIGVGYMPSTNVITKDELLIPVHLPFEGSGRDLRKHAEKFVRKMNKVVRNAQ
jgi:hypothetical protein